MSATFSSIRVRGIPIPAGCDHRGIRWYLRYGLSYRDVDELLAERGIKVDHVTVYSVGAEVHPITDRRCTTCRHAAGDRWVVDATSAKVAGPWVYWHRAIDQVGHVIDVLVTDAGPGGHPAILTGGLEHGPSPSEVTTDTRPPTRGCSTSCCLPHAMSPSNTKITPSHPITDC